MIWKKRSRKVGNLDILLKGETYLDTQKGSALLKKHYVCEWA